MSIYLNTEPSIDPNGVKHWTFDLGAGNVLDVVERPEYRRVSPLAVFRLSLSHCNGKRSHSFARNQTSAQQLARYIERDVAEGARDAGYQIITRAIHKRGVRQALALEALAKRGFSLTPKQRQRAELLDAAA